jgi:hypothetical protein
MQTQSLFPVGESALERLHPHIVERLCLTWGHPEGGRYLAKLIVDMRGGRAGFSADVMAELLTLSGVAADLGGTPLEATPGFGAPSPTQFGKTLKKWIEPTLEPLSFRLA